MGAEKQHQVVVIGAGPAGIASAVALKDRGVHPLVLDRADQVAASWRSRYDRLRLNTGRQFSHLPGRKYPKGTPIHPTRDQVVEHLQTHACEEGIELRLGTNAERIDRDGAGWSIRTSAGELAAGQVIVATGYEHSPLIPDWEGRAAYSGELLHSSAYRNPRPFAGRSVLVVGAGCSGMEIAYDLATGGSSKVWLSVRTPPNIIGRQGPAGLPGDVIAIPLYHAPIRLADAVARFGRKMDFGDLSEYGLPVPEEGVFARSARLGVAPAILDKEVVEAIKDGKVEVVRGVESLDQAGANLVDGARVEPEAIVCATGYRRGLEPLVGHLGVLTETGAPKIAGQGPSADGLWFIGYVPRPAQFGFAGKQAKHAARVIAKQLG